MKTRLSGRGDKAGRWVSGQGEPLSLQMRRVADDRLAVPTKTPALERRLRVEFIRSFLSAFTISYLSFSVIRENVPPSIAVFYVEIGWRCTRFVLETVDIWAI